MEMHRYMEVWARRRSGGDGESIVATTEGKISGQWEVERRTADSFWQKVNYCRFFVIRKFDLTKAEKYVPNKFATSCFTCFQRGAKAQSAAFWVRLDAPALNEPGLLYGFAVDFRKFTSRTLARCPGVSRMVLV